MRADSGRVECQLPSETTGSGFPGTPRNYRIRPRRGTIGALCVDEGASRPPSFLHLGRTGMGYPLYYELLSSLQVTGKNLPDFEMIILKWGYELPSPQKVRGSGVHLSLGVFTFSEIALLLTLKLHISEGLKLGSHFYLSVSPSRLKTVFSVSVWILSRCPSCFC